MNNNITKVKVCMLDLYKDGQLMNSEVKRLYRNVEDAYDYIKEQVDAYMNAYDGEAHIKECRDGFVEIEIRGWIRRYYYILKDLRD